MASEETFRRMILLIVVAVLLLPALMMAFMMPMLGMWGWGHMWNGGMWQGSGVAWMWLLVPLLMLAVTLALGYLIYRAIRHSASESTDPALEELRLAYARGELSEEEFEGRRDRLQEER